MSDLFKKTLSLLTGAPAESSRPLKKLTERELIELEAEIGGKLFGPIPAGHRREFFCLDEHTWVWHEEWVDENRQRKVTSTRYEIHDNGILKAQDGKVYKFIEGAELRNLVLAIRLYYEAVARGIYQRDPTTGRPLSGASTGTI
jgi:hypothetical protein